MENEPSIVISNSKCGIDLYEMVLRAPQISSAAKPAQFVHVELPTMQANILRRPFSLLDVDSQMGTVSILYQVVGEGTYEMSKWQPGYLTTMIGPVGNSWSCPDGAKHALLIGGGVGSAPLFMLYKQLIEQEIEVDVVLGASTKDAHVCHSKYSGVAGISPFCATDDGSFGTQGFCTVCVEALLEEVANEQRDPYDYAAICGPKPMMRAAAKLTSNAKIPTQVSLEKRMACGIGACLSCVCDTTDGKKRVCVDGPVFNVEELGWQ